MGNASARDQQTKSPGQGAVEWGVLNDAVFEGLLNHWRVDAAELEDLEDPPTPDSRNDGLAHICRIAVVKWRGDPVALKRCISLDELRQELAVWFRIRPHSCIVGFRGVVVGRTSLLTDFMALGSLETFLTTSTSTTSTPAPALTTAPPIAWTRQALSLLLDVTRGMDHLHSEGFVWRDCAARNVLLCRDANVPGLLRARITDFGFARAVPDASQGGRLIVPAQTHNLPLRILAPEALARSQAEYSAHSDVWALGVLLYSLLARRRPYSGLPTEDVIRGVCDGSLVLSPDDLMITETTRVESEEGSPPEELGTVVRRLFKHCLTYRPDDRPSTAAIIHTLAHLLADHSW